MTNGEVIGYASNGTLIFSDSLSNVPVTGITQVSGGWIVVQGSQISYIDSSGNIKWTVATKGAVEGGNVAVAGNTVYAVTDSTTMATYDLLTGN